MTTQTTKTPVTAAEFEKRVEIEAQNLMYFDHMKKEKAFDEARQTVSQKFAVRLSGNHGYRLM